MIETKRHTEHITTSVIAGVVDAELEIVRSLCRTASTSLLFLSFAVDLYSLKFLPPATGLIIGYRDFLNHRLMKEMFYELKHKAELVLDESVATKGRPRSFKIVVAALFAIDVIAFITFCIIKLTA
jgi:hypothetical protein